MRVDTVGGDEGKGRDPWTDWSIFLMKSVGRRGP